MKRYKDICLALIATLGIFILIIDTKTAITGAMDGIDLCVKTLIPSLFPFFFVSGFFCNSWAQLSLSFLKPVIKFCKIPSNASTLLVIGALGGYPVGAKAISDAYKDGALHIDQARRTLGFCSNAGPAFVFGVLTQSFSTSIITVVLFAIQLLSAVITGWLLPQVPNDNTKIIEKIHHRKQSLFDGCLKATMSVCGWVILFRVLIAFLQRWILWLAPNEIKTLILGLLELTNGCISLREVSNEGLRFIISCAILSFGGLCVFLQTITVTDSLGTGLYLPGKIIQSMISTALSCVIHFALFNKNNQVSIGTCLILITIAGFILMITRKYILKKTVAILPSVLYNTRKRKEESCYALS